MAGQEHLSVLLRASTTSRNGRSTEFAVVTQCHALRIRFPRKKPNRTIAKSFLGWPSNAPRPDWRESSFMDTLSPPAAGETFIMPRSKVGTIHAGLVVAMAAATLAASAATAQAASARVRAACEADYLAYCSQYPEEGAAVRKCMDSHGAQLSKHCVDALVADGEISRNEVEKRRSAARR
jgi:hypothetical protein